MKVNQLLIVDDTVLVAHSKEKLSNWTRKLGRICKGSELKKNVGRVKY